MQDQRGGVRYHRRYMKPTPFVMAAFATLAVGAMIAIVHSSTGTLFGLICLANFLIWIYLTGPAMSVTVRGDTLLEVNNSFVRYVIPPGRIDSIGYVEALGVRVSLEGDKQVWVGALSRGQFRWKRVSDQELEANAKGLTDALFATPPPADLRQVKRGCRWANLFAVVVGATGLLVLYAVAQSLGGHQ
jgi:hypothetical protein